MPIRLSRFEESDEKTRSQKGYARGKKSYASRQACIAGQVQTGEPRFQRRWHATIAVQHAEYSFPRDTSQHGAQYRGADIV
jgi:hypothetical protein